MSRQVVIALVGSVLFVAVAFWIVTLLVPGPPADPIIGKWRIAGRSDCDEAKGYLAITTDSIVFTGKGKSVSPVVITAFDSDANGRRLRVYLKDGIDDMDFFLPYQITDDTLTFSTGAWTQEARNKYASQLSKMDGTPLSPPSLTSKILQIYQPLHRCTG